MRAQLPTLYLFPVITCLGFGLTSFNVTFASRFKAQQPANIMPRRRKALDLLRAASEGPNKSIDDAELSVPGEVRRNIRQRNFERKVMSQ